MNPILVNICGKTDEGCVREHNEDSILIYNKSIEENQGKFVANNFIVIDQGVLFMVADGMGGTNAGEVASGLAKAIIRQSFSQLDKIPSNPGNFLKSNILDVHKKIQDTSKSNVEYKGMGTTIVLGWLINNIMHIAWVGDSRCYILEPEQKEEFGPFTDDHSLVWNLVMSGEISPEQARTDEQSNIILQSLGGEQEKPEPDYKNYQVKQGNRILFCSDGLNGMLSDQGIQQILLFEKNTCDACDKMVQAAKNAGGKDNISVLLLDVLSDVPPMHTQKKKPARKKSRFKFWIFTFLTISFFFLILYLSDQGVLSLFNNGKLTDSNDSQETSEIVTKDKVKVKNRKPSKIIIPDSLEITEDTVTIELLDSIRYGLSEDIIIKLTSVEKELNSGSIEQIDEHVYNKILFQLIEVKNTILADSLSYTEINDSIHNEIDFKKEILVKLDSMESEIGKLNKLKKLKSS